MHCGSLGSVYNMFQHMRRVIAWVDGASGRVRWGGVSSTCKALPPYSTHILPFLLLHSHPSFHFSNHRYLPVCGPQRSHPKRAGAPGRPPAGKGGSTAPGLWADVAAGCVGVRIGLRLACTAQHSMLGGSVVDAATVCCWHGHCLSFLAEAALLLGVEP